MNANGIVLAVEPQSWAAEREAARAAAVVAIVVGVPAFVAAGAALTLFALTAAVLLAPLVAVILTYAAWRFNRPPVVASGGDAPSPEAPAAGGTRA